jgi:hypothetical protein
MGTVTTDQIKPGMVVATDVKDRSGRMLLAAGSTITEKHIRIFRMWGITEVELQGAVPEPQDQAAAPQSDPLVHSEAEARVNELFFHANCDHPVVGEIRRMALKRTIKKLAEGEHGR